MRGDELIQIEILGIGTRRGPAPEAQTLYKQLNLALDTAAKYPMSA